MEYIIKVSTAKEEELPVVRLVGPFKSLDLIKRWFRRRKWVAQATSRELDVLDRIFNRGKKDYRLFIWVKKGKKRTLHAEVWKLISPDKNIA